MTGALHSLHCAVRFFSVGPWCSIVHVASTAHVGIDARPCTRDVHSLQPLRVALRAGREGGELKADTRCQAQREKYFTYLLQKGAKHRTFHRQTVCLSQVSKSVSKLLTYLLLK